MRDIARVTVSSVAVATLAGGLVGPVPAAGQPAQPLPVIAVAASGHDGNVPENTLDGDLGTRWSDQGDGVWIELELDDTYPIGSVDIAWHKGDQRVADFEVRLSTNGSSWTTVFDGSSSGTTLQPETYPFPATSARYVRIVGFGNSQNDWTSITELAVYEDGGGTPSTLPVLSVAASGHDGNVPENTLDGDLGTRWSDQGDGVWIELALDDTYPIGSVDIAWHKGDQRVADFEVRLSTNGSSWETVFDGSSSGTTLQPETYPFTTTSARYVRIVGFGNTQNDWTSITELPGFALEGGGSCTYPGEILDLTNWKITLPIDDPDRSGTQPLEIFQPELDTYALNPWFVTTAGCDAVRFRNAVNGVTTPNSSYSRSELREMTDNGTEHASWSSTSGTHTIVVTQAITSLPNDKPHVVAGQIHDSSDDVTVFRLEGSNLYVTDGNDTHHHLITSNYSLGTVFEAKFVVSDGEIEAYYNGGLETTLSKSFSGGYFKAGAYTQANCGNSSPCSSDNYGEVIVYDVTVTHT